MSDALNVAAVGIGGEKLGIAVHAGHEHDLCAVRRPGRSAIGAAETRPGDQALGQDRVHADLRAELRAAGRVASESDAAAVRGPARGQGDGAQGSELALIGAVIVHDPHFLVAAAPADERNLGAGNAGDSAGKASDDLIGKLMSELAHLRLADHAAVDAPDDGRRGRVAHVLKPGLDREVVAFRGQITEREKLGRGRRLRPDRAVQFGRQRRNLQGIEAPADQFQDAAEVEVVAHDVAEQSGKRLRCGGARREVGHGHASLGDSQARAGAKPILRRRRDRGYHAQQQCHHYAQRRAFVNRGSFRPLYFHGAIHLDEPPATMGRCRAHRLKSNQNSTDTRLPLYSLGSACTGWEPRMARMAELSTDALPLERKICTLVMEPLRRMSKLTTARGANLTDGSTVLCSQLLLTRERTASTYQEKRLPKSPPPPGPPKPMPAVVAPSAPILNSPYGTLGAPP